MQDWILRALVVSVWAENADTFLLKSKFCRNSYFWQKNSPKPKLNLRSNTNLNAAMFNISCSIYEYFDSKQYYRVKIIRWLLEPYNRIWLVNPSTQILIKTHVWCLKSKKKTTTSFSFFFFFLNWKVWIPRIVKSLFVAFLRKCELDNLITKDA